MADDLAPLRSPRPTPRTTPEERRARETAMADAFAALEDRADMDRYLADDPLARLGYREIGGLRGVQFLPLADEQAAYYGRGYQLPELDEEIAEAMARGDDRLPVLDSVRLMHPDAYDAFQRGATDSLIPPRTIGLGPDYVTEAVKAHEAGHAGFDFVEDALARDPELAQRFRDAGFAPRASRAYEEAVVELSDDPMDTWIQPRREDRPTGTYSTLEHTIQYPGSSDREREGLARYREIMEGIAQEELTRRGEPPRAVMRQPQPGNIFYREPEPEPRGGLLGLLDRIRGN